MVKLVFYTITKTVLHLVSLLVSVAFLTLVERKVLASMQRRKGPNRVGFLGLMQPFSDGIKMLTKELIFPSSSNRNLFVLAPLITLFFGLVGWVVIPFGEGLVFVDMEFGLLYLFAVSSMAVYGIIVAGWASNSKYAFLGGLRSAAQMISYEVSIGLGLLPLVVVSGGLNLTKLVLFQSYIWFCFPFFPLMLIFFISVLAEVNRPPFDLPEAEAELVSGYNVEYSATGFVFFFIGEYSNLILSSVLFTTLFLGGFLGGTVAVVLKYVLVLYIFVWVRAVFPRFRYDQLMRLGWKVFLPFVLGWLVFTVGVVWL